MHYETKDVLTDVTLRTLTTVSASVALILVITLIFAIHEPKHDVQTTCETACVQNPAPQEGK